LAKYAAQPNIPVKHIGGLLVTAHAQADSAMTSADQSSGKTVHGLRMPMNTGLLEAEAFAQVISSLNKSLQASTEALFR
jgi:hypothetical protein